MYNLPFSILLLLVTIMQANAWEADSTENPIDPCVGYWKLSYQHPDLVLADSLYAVERFSEALPLYQAAAEKFNRQLNWKGLLKARNRVADCFRFTSLADSAYSILQGNLEIIEEHFNNDPNEIAEVHFIMGICYDWGNQKDKSLEEFNKSLEIRIGLYGENHIDVVRGYKYFGDMLAWDSQNLIAKEFLSKAADLFETINCKNDAIIFEIYYSLAEVSRELRDLEKAEIYCMKAISLFENDPLSKSRSYNQLANIHEDQNKFEQSIRYNTLAINLLQEQQPLSNSLQQNLAFNFQSLAHVYMLIQMYDSAHQYYQNSLQIYNKLHEENEVLLLYQNIGINYYLMGQNDSADYYLTKAVALRKQVNGEKHFDTSASLREQGSYYQYQGQLDSALHYYQRAIVAAASPDYNDYRVDSNPPSGSFTFDDEGSLLNALYLKGLALKNIYLRDRDLGTLEKSLETLLLAIEVMDQNQKLYLLEGSTLLMAEDYYSVFEDALGACYTLYGLSNNQEYLETAFFIMEKSKARLLFDTFTDLQKSRMVGIPDSLIKAENNIRSRLASFSRDLESKKQQESASDQEIRELEDKVFEATVELEEFRQSLESAYPSYASTIESKPLDSGTILDKLSEQHQTMVNYFWGDSALFSLVLQNHQISFFRQPVDSLAQLVRNYQQHLHHGPQFTNQAARFRDFQATAHKLFNVLFKGINMDGRPLIIAADGPLRFIPFEGLVIEKPASDLSDYHQLDYVVNHYPTSYVYSANMWAMQPQQAPAKLQALAFSHSAPDLISNSQSGNELPGTAREIEILKSQLQGSFFSGLEATKQNFVDHAQNYDIIHLSIHGISDSTSRLNNRLLFRNPEDREQLDPLFTYELYNLKLNSKIAVLSACESGTGRNYQGEGVYSMSRAFSYAGCPTTVMSLWRISDKTTPEILEQFYRQVSKGKEIDQALRHAKLSYLKNNQGNAAHPSYWAAMVVHGNTDPVMKKSRTVLTLSLLIALLVLTMVFIKVRSPR